MSAHFQTVFLRTSSFAIGLLILVGCQNRPAQTDLSMGKIGYAIWPDCRLNVETSAIHCKCSDFVMDLRADGKTVIRCVK